MKMLKAIKLCLTMQPLSMYIIIEIGNENLVDIFHVNVISMLNVSYSILRYMGDRQV